MPGTTHDAWLRRPLTCSGRSPPPKQQPIVSGPHKSPAILQILAMPALPPNPTRTLQLPGTPGVWPARISRKWMRGRWQKAAWSEGEQTTVRLQASSQVDPVIHICSVRTKYPQHTEPMSHPAGKRRCFGLQMWLHKGFFLSVWHVLWRCGEG